MTKQDRLASMACEAKTNDKADGVYTAGRIGAMADTDGERNGKASRLLLALGENSRRIGVATEAVRRQSGSAFLPSRTSARCGVIHVQTSQVFTDWAGEGWPDDKESE